MHVSWSEACFEWPICAKAVLRFLAVGVIPDPHSAPTLLCMQTDVGIHVVCLGVVAIDYPLGIHMYMKAGRFKKRSDSTLWWVSKGVHVF